MSSGICADVVDNTSSDIDRLIASSISSLPLTTVNVPTDPSKGRLVALRTLAEVQSTLKFEDAYIVRIPAQAAHNILGALIRVTPPNSIAHLQHVRRFVKPEHISSHILELLEANEKRHAEQQQQSNVNPTPGNAPSHLADLVAPSLFLFASPISLLPVSTLLTTLSPHLNLPARSIPYSVLAIPSSPPSSAAAAAELSAKYWPTTYKAHNPHGPQPADIRRAKAEIEGRAGERIGLARRLGRKAKERGHGEEVGAVIVDPRGGDGGKGEVVAGAGDGRWICCSHEAHDDDEKPNVMSKEERVENGNGNPLAHAAMRAIGMVGRQRIALDRAEAPASSTVALHVLDLDATADLNPPFFDIPLSPLESAVSASSPLRRGGYLCTGLDVYLSREPCVMCSMAIVHSRFSRIIFAGPARLLGQGGMCAEEIVQAKAGQSMEEGEGGRTFGYGLFWRPELNWRMLAWEWVGDEDDTHGVPG